MNKSQFFTVFICLFIALDLFAQNEQKQIHMGSGNNVIRYVTNNDYTIIQIDTAVIENLVKKEIDSVKAFLTEFINKQEQMLKQIEQKDVDNKNLITQLNEEIRIYKNALDLVNRKKQEIEAKRWNYLPFGVHQFTTKQTDRGILFLGTQIGLSISGGFLASKTRNTYNTLQNEPYQSEARHNNLKNSYRLQLTGTITCFAGVVASIIWNYCDNSKKERNENVSLAPTVMLDWQGKPQMGVNLSISF